MCYLELKGCKVNATANCKPASLGAVCDGENLCGTSALGGSVAIPTDWW